MTFKSAMSTLGNGILATGSVLHNTGIQTQINEVDAEILELEKQLTALRDKKTDLEGRLIKP